MTAGNRSPRARRAFAVLAAALVGLGAAPARGAAPPPAPGCDPSWPVVAHHAGGAVVAAATDVVACGVETGYATSESTIAVTPKGTLIYSPAQTENSMARSTDRGSTWNLTLPAQAQATAFWNTVDPHVVSDPRTGRIFWAHATGPVRNEGGLPYDSGFWLAAAYGFQVYSSADDGRTWTTADYQTAPTGDWEKVFVGPPPPASSGAAQPSGYPDIVYLCANSPLEVSGPGRLCYKSLDGGATFEIAGYVSPSVGQPADICMPLDFNTSVVDGRGTIFTPATCDNGAYIAVSGDEGSTYTWLSVPNVPGGGYAGANLLQIAVDRAGTLYASWPADGLLYLEVSKDHGVTWSRPLMVAAPGVGTVTRPTLAAGAAGHVAFTYYASTDPSASMLSAYITETADGADASPLFVSAPINDPAQPIYHDGGLTGGSPRTDFVGGAFDGAGTTFWAGVVKQFGPPDADNKLVTTGYVGHLEHNAPGR